MGFSGGHLLLIILLLGIGLIIFGPKRLPEIGSGLGRAIREFKVGVSEVHNSTTQSPPSHDAQTVAPPNLPGGAQAPQAAAPGAPVDPLASGDRPAV
ncbi:MAG: twin-arginine translocase TatA/TatE family subunit [Candidatus Dormibacteria bacterium]